MLELFENASMFENASNNQKFASKYYISDYKFRR